MISLCAGTYDGYVLLLKATPNLHLLTKKQISEVINLSSRIL